jgi:hypothetical protein
MKRAHNSETKTKKMRRLVALTIISTQQVEVLVVRFGRWT